jgi:hypothetical protein
MIPYWPSNYVAEGPAPVIGIVYTYDQICEETEMSPVEIRIPTHWTLIACSMTVPPLMLSPSTILPSSSSHCAFIPTGKKIGERLKNVISVFRDVRKIATISSVTSPRPSVRSSVRTEQLGSQWTDFSVKLYIWVIFENMPRKFKFC